MLIPGSNNDCSYVLEPEAGRGEERVLGEPRRGPSNVARRGCASSNQRKIDDEYAAAGILVNLDGRVPIDEAAPCYKRSEEVVAAVVGAGLATVEYTLWPLASLKGTEGAGRKKRQASSRKSRSTIDSGSSSALRILASRTRSETRFIEDGFRAKSLRFAKCTVERTRTLLVSRMELIAANNVKDISKKVL